MTEIKINSLASLKRALAQPGLVLILDENTYMGHTLQRDPEAMRIAVMPRKIIDVKSDSFSFERGDGKTVYQNFPLRFGLLTSGDNSFSIVAKKADSDEMNRITYRVVDPSVAYEPSRLPINHPMLPQEVIDQELAEKAAAEKAIEDRILAAKDRISAVKASPPVQPDPEYQVFADTMETVIRDVVISLKKENRHLGVDQLVDTILQSPVVRETDFAEFAEFVQSEDVVVPHGALPVEATALVDEAYYDLTSKPRGTWREYRVADKDDSLSSNKPDRIAFVSLGNGQALDIVLDAGETFSPEFLLKKMLRYESYQFLEKVRSDLELEQANQKISQFNFAVGNVYKNLEIGRHRFATVTVTDIDRNDKGQIDTLGLSMTKRGSKNQWTARLKASELADRIVLPSTSPLSFPQKAEPAATPARTSPAPGF